MPNIKDPADYIVSINMNGLRGRMLRMPPPKNRKNKEILFVYGHHASIERQFGVIEVLNRYGGVTLPDLPGFGGMDSFYKIGLKPTLDNLADYLAAFIKLHYKRKKVSIVAMSLGFAITTRMLQKFPELTNRVSVLVSVVGFVNHEEFKFTKRNYWLMRSGAWFFSHRGPAFFARHVLLRPILIRTTYKMVADKHSKLKDANEQERDRRIDFEIGLWHANDVRTYMSTTITMFTIDLLQTKVDLPLYHIEVAEDRYFDAHVVEQHMNVIYDGVQVIRTHVKNHGPTVIANAKQAEDFIPAKLRRILRNA